MYIVLNSGKMENNNLIVPIFEDPLSKNVFEIARKIASTDASVLITGETGTGKEVLAKYIHQNSERHKNKYVCVNCAAIPDTMLESEFFGHEKGAFTGAIQKRIGKFEEASKGTILLDEISEMSLNLQAKLLRVIQEKEISRLGGNEVVKTNARIIATSNKDLRQAIEEKTFREDLFYRLNVIPIKIPALNQRPKDIAPLARFFCKKYSGGEKVLSDNLIERLECNEWKGNVRELENFVNRAVILSPNQVIRLEDLKIIDPEASIRMPPTKNKKYNKKM